jgi:hypothetical protein
MRTGPCDDQNKKNNEISSFLKVVSGEKEGGSAVFTFDRHWYGTLALEV